MGRFSPTIQERPRSTFATALLEGVDAFQNARQQKRAEEERAADRAVRGQAAADTHAAALAKYAGEGGRFGTAPDEAGLDLTFRDNPTFEPPSNEQLAAGLRGEPVEAAPESSPFAINPRDFAAQLAGSGPPVAATAPLQPSAPPRPQPVIPGAFVPETGTFGGGPPSPTALAIGRAAARTVHLGPTGRYTQIDPTHYIDETATPGAERAADREAQLKIANEAKLGQIAATSAGRAAVSEAHDTRAADLQLGGVDPVTGQRTGGVIAARGAQSRETQTAKPAPPTHYSRYMTQDGRLWLGSTTDPNDVHQVIDPRTGQQAIGSLPTLSVEDEAHPGGVIVTRADALGREPAHTGIGGGATGAGSGGIGSVARQAAGIVELENAHNLMKGFEEDVRSGKVNYSGLDYYKGLYARLYDAHGGFDRAANAAALSNLQATNPDLANYLTAAELFALADSQISGRPSDFRTKLDAFVSAIGPRSGARNIDNIQKTRQLRVDELNKFRPALEAIGDRMTGNVAGRGSKASTGKTPPPQSQDEYDHLIQAGMTDAQIVQRYGQPAAGIKRKP